MKIALVFEGVGFGGIGRVGIDYTRLLLEDGHEVDVYNLSPYKNEMVNELPPQVKYYPQKLSGKLCPDRYSYGVKRWRWGKYAYPIIYPAVKLALYFKRIFSRRRKYDLAIAFSGHFSDLTYVAYNFIKADKKLCWLHGNLAEYLLAAEGYITLYRKIKNLAVLSDLSQHAALHGNKFLKLNIKKIFNPSFIRERAVDGARVAELKEKHGDFMLNVARFTKRYAHKDQWTNIDALKILKEEYGLQNKVVFVGDGPARKEVEKYAEENGVAELCVFEGSKSDVQNYYSAAKVFVHSSITEGLPTTIIEALNFSLPTVATDNKSGVGDILDDGKCGMIVPIAEPRAMAESIHKMLTDESLYGHFKELSAERAAEFAPENIKIRLTEFLETLL